MSGDELADLIVDRARAAIDDPPFGTDETGGANLASNAFTLGLLTAANMIRSAQ